MGVVADYNGLYNQVTMATGGLNTILGERRQISQNAHFLQS